MTYLSRLLFIGVIVLLAAGPALALPVTVRGAPTMAAPTAAPSHARTLLEIVAIGVGVFGAIRIRDTGSLANKFAQRAGNAAGDYKEGVAQAGGDWETNTKNAADSFAQGVQEAISDGRYVRGVSDAGAGKYVKRAVELGAQRYGPGVQMGKDEWAKNTAPFLDRLKALTLPPRGPRRSPQNMQRANMVAQELGKLATGK